ncbi:HK97-gp10 family putative phage morphogenesis protein [Aurantimonas sp. A2-1-M11]|uniref:HK97-gp10 family putative phage morphogenesis protein n=1 Tax=Aurantimonas sp. A2-1-M11 TaxID=3113712 RepID=UPI002F94E25E
MATSVRGLKSLNRKLAAIPKEVRREVRKALEKGAYQIADTAYSLAPSDSGDLKRSIGYTFGKYTAANSNVRGVGASGTIVDSDLSVTVHAGDAKAFYAAFIEFGTAGHAQGGKFAGTWHPGTPPQPFFYPAYRLRKRGVKAGISRAVKKASVKVAKS